MPIKKIFKFDTTGGRKIYERQPDEPNKAFAQFVCYRDMGPERTLSGALEIYRKQHLGEESTNNSNLGAASKKYRWKERVVAWDNDLDRMRRLKQIREVEEMVERHIRMSQSMQGLAALELNKYIEMSQASKEEPIMTPSDTRVMAETGMRLERLNRGEPESVVQQEHTLNVDDIRNRMKRLAEDDDLSEHVEALRDAVIRIPDAEILDEV